MFSRFILTDSQYDLYGKRTGLSGKVLSTLRHGADTNSYEMEGQLKLGCSMESDQSELACLSMTPVLISGQYSTLPTAGGKPMAKSVVKRKKTSGVAKGQSREIWDLDLGAYLSRKVLSTRPRSPDGYVIVNGASKPASQIKKLLKDEVPSEQLKKYREGRPCQRFVTHEGQTLWLVQAQLNAAPFRRRDNNVRAEAYGKLRDVVGALFNGIEAEACEKLIVRFEDAGEDEILGFLVGCELAAYSFKKALRNEVSHISLYFEDVHKNLIAEAKCIAGGVNLARHLVNMPPNLLYPQSFADTIEKLFGKYAGVKIQVWDEKRLQKEGMLLHLAVGGASQHLPRLVQIQYRPAKSRSKKRPVALVGKGITFDSGGLDLKSAVGMRLMKKDMGGAAAILGSFYSLIESGFSDPLDLYLPLAENAVSDKSFRPGDVIRSRSGKSVEIHNTDAEGRLVLADSLSLATEDNAPRAVINVATLTGAVKVGLGVEIGGFFCNDDDLAKETEKASRELGDLMWEMPLYEGYRSQLKTQVAEINHCGTSGYGGALTAALFLYDFVGEHPFLHFDIYGWTDQPKGAFRESGGSGQAVQCLYRLLKNF